jgi:MtN3 and saliva related transmembrane protein
MPADIFSHENIVLITGITAGILTATSMMPQVFKTIKTQKAENISPVMLIILIAGVSLWVVYGCMKKDWPIILTNSFSVLINTCMLFLQWKFREKKT